MSRAPASRQTRIVLSGVAAATGLICAPAIAFWSGPGEGAATATLADPLVLSLSPGEPESELYPGGSTTVKTVASNPNNHPVEISSISLDEGEAAGGLEPDSAHNDCAPALEFATQSNDGQGWTVPARVGTTPGELEIALPDALAMGLGASDSCQGATYVVHLLGDTP